MTLLEIEKLTTEFTTRRGTVRAVDDVSLSIQRGQTLAIVGESGCGKSTTAMSIIGLLPRQNARIAGGHVYFNGKDLVGRTDAQLNTVRGPGIGTIFQDPLTSLNPSFTVGRQLVETIRTHLSKSKAEAKVQAIEALREVRLPDPEGAYDSYPHQLSGGMRQRVMIALALSCSPELLIADEPTTALDVTIQAEILVLLERLRAERGMGMLLITHDMGVAAETADNVAVMYAGQVVEYGPVSEVLLHPEHPYTIALMGALPPLDSGDVRHGRLTAIPGSPPDLASPPGGDRYAARFLAPEDIPGPEVPSPELIEIRHNHWVRTERKDH